MCRLSAIIYSFAALIEGRLIGIVDMRVTNKEKIPEKICMQIWKLFVLSVFLFYPILLKIIANYCLLSCQSGHVTALRAKKVRQCNL